LVAVAAIVVFCAGRASATPVDGPSGSYRETCKNIRQRGDTLYARCKGGDDRWHDTSLDEIGRCTDDINNINGRLQCNKEAREVVHGRAPEGSYAATCRDIHVDGSRLSARCRTGYGDWVESSLNLDGCRGDISNNDGRLRCATTEERDEHLPPGSYTQSCRDIRVEGDYLQARCQSGDGDWRDARLEDFRRCYGGIVNDDGRLECTRRDGWSVPRGSYTETCRQIYLRGDTLRASCQNGDGRWVWSQLDDWDNCREGIFNDDGHLRCRR